ncbi:MAG: biliverdin-producing heme oxygenase [Dokdonella sp.]
MRADETPLSLAARLRAGTRDLHRRAERSGVMHTLLRGRLEREPYCVLLRNLHAIYVALEAGLEEHAAHTAVAHLHDRALYRAEALASDLENLHGNNWGLQLALASRAHAYAQRLRGLAGSEPIRLVAHVYVRYLGDLNGGQMLSRIVQASMRLDDVASTAFYRFTPEPATILEAPLRDGLDAMPVTEAQKGILVDEARWSFIAHCELFDELSELATHSRSRA